MYLETVLEQVLFWIENSWATHTAYELAVFMDLERMYTNLSQCAWATLGLMIAGFTAMAAYMLEAISTVSLVTSGVIAAHVVS